MQTSFKFNILNHYRCSFIKRICAYSEGEKEGIIVFKVFHIGDPFTDQRVIGPSYVAREMILVGRGMSAKLLRYASSSVR